MLPEALTKKLSDGVRLAAATRSASIQLKSTLSNKDRNGSRVANGLFYRFKHAIAEVNARFDTIALLLGDETASETAEAIGCTWDATSRKVVLKEPDKPA